MLRHLRPEPPVSPCPGPLILPLPHSVLPCLSTVGREGVAFQWMPRISASESGLVDGVHLFCSLEWTPAPHPWIRLLQEWGWRGLAIRESSPDPEAHSHL